MMSELKSQLQADLQSALLSDSPDLAETHSRLQQQYKLSQSQARDLIWQTVLQINTNLFPPITKLEIIHTEGCNLACKYCFEKKMLSQRRMPLETGLAAVDLLFAYAGDEEKVHITHFGGEPTLNYPAIKIITEYAEKKAQQCGKKLELHITTNGVLLNHEMTSYFADHQIMVLLSLDGLQESHDRFRVDRRGRGTYDRVVAGLRLLKKTQGWVGVKMTVMPENAPNLYNDVSGLYHLGINQFLIDYATGIPWTEKEIKTFIQQLRKVYHWYQKCHDQNLKIHDFDKTDRKTGYFGCQAGRNSISVSVYGDISPCSKVLALNSQQPLARLGDINYGLTHLRNRMEIASCNKLAENCEVNGIAENYQGGCFASNYEDNHDLFQPSMQDVRFSLLKQSVFINGNAGCSQ